MYGGGPRRRKMRERRRRRRKERGVGSSMAHTRNALYLASATHFEDEKVCGPLMGRTPCMSLCSSHHPVLSPLTHTPSPQTTHPTTQVGPLQAKSGARGDKHSLGELDPTIHPRSENSSPPTHPPTHPGGPLQTNPSARGHQHSLGARPSHSSSV